MRSVAILSGILFVLPGALAAQQQAPPEIVRDDRLAVLEQRVRALEDELSLLKEALKAARAPMVAKIRESQAAPPRLLLASAAAPVAEAEATAPAAGLSSTPEPVANAAQAQAGPLPIYGGASAAAKALNPDISVIGDRSEEHTSELQSPCNLVCRLLLEKKKKKKSHTTRHAMMH